MNKYIRHSFITLLLLSCIQQAIAQLPMPDTVCKGASRTYKVNDALTPSTYTWMVNGVPQPGNLNEVTILWNMVGVFQLSVQEHAGNGCDGEIQTATVNVLPVPVADAGNDVLVCFGKISQLQGSGGTTYNWTPAAYLSDPSSANPFVNLPDSGVYNYMLYVSSLGCTSVKPDTVKVTMLPPVRVSAGNDTIIALNQPLQLAALDVYNSGFINYQWSPSMGLDNAFIKNPVAVISNPGTTTYLLTASTADGCVSSDDIKVTVFIKADIYVPTGFTPNGDGLNDQALVITSGITQLNFFNIYNRWGEMVFSTKDPGKGWNGYFKGVLQDSNVFIWEAKGIDYNGITIYKKGTLTLIR